MNILNKIKIHIIFYILLFLCVITGNFKECIIFTCFILIHELGHILVAIMFNWKIEKIVILPFGAITIFNEKINRPLKQELLIALAGITFQTIFYIFLCTLNIKEEIFVIHYAILIFNLLPIYPLDGFKILNILINYILSFKKSHIVSLILSFIFIFISLSVLKENLIFFLMLILFFIRNIEEVFKHKYIFNKFLLERYLYNIKLKKIKTIKGKKIEKMQRDKYHFFIINQKIYKEKDILNKMYAKIYKKP